MEHGSRRWIAGSLLALSVAVLWGALPIGLKIALVSLDVWTITWWRFAGAMGALGIWLAWSGQLPGSRLREGALWRLLAPAALGLTANYVLYLLGLHYTSPAVAQTVIQIAPLLLVLFGVLLFKERFSGLQWVGFGTLVLGLAAFFNRRLPELLYPTSTWAFGVILLVMAGISWAIYGAAQKQLLQRLTSAQVLFLIYVAATLLLLPMSDPAAVVRLDLTGLAALAFCIMNTIVAYGAFGLALETWELSRVSSVVSTAPLFTLAASMAAAHSTVGWIQPEPLNGLSVAGALCVVAGSMISALGNRRGGRPDSTPRQMTIHK